MICMDVLSRMSSIQATASYSRPGNPDSEFWKKMLVVASMQKVPARRVKAKKSWMDRKIAERWREQRERERERCKVKSWWGPRGKRHP